MLEPKIILYPVGAMIALTFIVIIWMAILRFASVFRGDLKGSYFVYNRGQTEPAYLTKVTHNFDNLLQVPILFYALCAFLYMTNQVSTTLYTLAWVYVGFRILHTLIHTTINHVMLRFAAFAVSTVVLGVMWARFLLGL
jgi:hypothetical protein